MNDDEKHFEKLKLEVETWKKTVDVQQHFNDIALRIRNLAISVLLAAMAAAGLAAKDKVTLRMFDWNAPLSAIFLLVGVLGWGAFYWMDHLWYHRLLKGAVENGKAIEARLGDELPGIKLAQAITESSHIKFKETWATKAVEVKAGVKLVIFYAVPAILLTILAIGIIVGSLAHGDSKIPAAGPPTNSTPIVNGTAELNTSNSSASQDASGGSDQPSVTPSPS